MKISEQVLLAETLAEEATKLLKRLICIPSISREEERTAEMLQAYLEDRGIPVERQKNNVWARNFHFDPNKPTILLNSHHDTVRPNGGYTLDPFSAIETEGKLFGLGSNDAGGALVSLLAVFLYFYECRNLKCNLIFAASAEEEISGENGIELLLPSLGKVDLAIVGEPTGMNMAIAEKGLMVLDCRANGSAGHAAREEGENAIYKAMRDIEWFRGFRFPKSSALLGQVKMSVTMINSGSQHNVVPDRCEFTVDVRTTDAYSNEEILGIIREHVGSDVEPRSTRLRASGIPGSHPVVLAAQELDIRLYGSPTLSDQALMNFPSVKIGPGDPSRSHTADEFIFLTEIDAAIDVYIKLLNKIML